MNMKHIVGTLALAAAATHAGAVDINWGEHGTQEIAVNAVAPGSFTDYVSFTLTDATTLAATTVSTNLMPLLGIEDGEISLYADGADANDVLLQSYAFSGETGSTVNWFPDTGPGSYFYKITGTATGSIGGFYSLASAVAAPVPEPRTGALVLSALATIGLIARRGRRS